MITAYKMTNLPTTLEQIKVRRDWMDATFDKHAYRCFPLSTANVIGWGISYPEDIVVEWDGIAGPENYHVKVLQGNQYCHTDTGNGTVTFISNYVFKTDENTSMLCMQPPNLFIDGAQSLTSVISTSWYNQMFAMAWKITKPNQPVIFKAGTPIVCLLPVSLQKLQDTEMIVVDKEFDDEYFKQQESYLKMIASKSHSGEWGMFYRDAVDENGNIKGSHEVKILRLKTTDRTNRGQ